MNIQSNTHYATCFCGAVELTLSGSPELMAYCHCDSCRHWAAGPVSRFSLWQPENVKVSKGEAFLASFDKNSSQNGGDVISERTWCKQCGGHLFTNHPIMGLIDVPAVIIKSFSFQPEIHVNYQETVMPIKDGLPKFKDLPEPAGGSGELLPE